MTKIYRIFIALLFSSFLSACSIVSGVSDTLSSHDDNNYQDISVSAIMNGDNNVAAECRITHNHITHYKAIAPFSMRVRKSHEPLYIQCHYNGFESSQVKLVSVNTNNYKKDHISNTKTRWENEGYHSDWYYPSVVNVPLNDFDNFYNHSHFYPDKTVPAGVFLSRNAGKML